MVDGAFTMNGNLAFMRARDDRHMHVGTPPWPRSRRALMLAAALAAIVTLMTPGAPARAAAVDMDMAVAAGA